MVTAMGMSMTTFAAELLNNQPLAVLEDGTKVIAAYRVIDGELLALTKSEYLSYKANEEILEARKEELKNSDSILDGVAPHVAGVPFTWYDERGTIEESTRHNLKTRISNYIYNYGSKDASLKISGSYTQGSTTNRALSSSEENAVKAEIGISLKTEYTFSQEITAIISGGCKGWMEFTPIMKNSYGYIQKGVTIDIMPGYVITSETWTDIYLPRQLQNGQLDGIYEILEAPL